MRPTVRIDMAERVTFVIGGARSGKSSYALKLGEERWHAPLYLATAQILDDEMARRVELHQQSRGAHWNCIEEPINIASVIEEAARDHDGLLIDCLTLWVSNVLLSEGSSAVASRSSELMAVLETAPEVIFVSNEVGMGIVPDNAMAREYRDMAGRLNQDIADVADDVILMTAGIPQFLKGSKKQ